MATNCERSTKRVALCSALAAGFAYVGYSILKNAFCRRESRRGGKHKDQGKMNQAIQTDVSLAYSSEALLLLPDICSIHKSVKERVKELNCFARQHGASEFCPGFMPRSLQSSPWSSPRILGSTDSRKFISYSAENISSVSPTKSPSATKKHSLTSVPNEDNFDNARNETVCSESESCDNKIIEESEESVLKRLDSLFSRARVITPFEAKSLVSLLTKKDIDILIKTLSAISNCSAFTINQDFFCDADCPNMLRELLTHPAITVKIAVTQAMSNLAANEKSQAVFQSCIPVLLHHATNRDGELLKTVSLTTLGNLALYNENHTLMIGSIQQLMDLLENSSSGIQLQTLKVLVNLSCNNSVAPALLASKAPMKLYSFLDEKSDYDICLRVTTLLANIMTVASELNIQISDLPMEHKAPCPETLFVVVFGYFGREILLKKVTLLMDSKDKDICQQASRIHNIVTKLF